MWKGPNHCWNFMDSGSESATYTYDCKDHLFYRHDLSYHESLLTACTLFWFWVGLRRQHSGNEETFINCTYYTFSWGKDTILYYMYPMVRQHTGKKCTVSSQQISKQTNAFLKLSSSNTCQTMLEGVCGCNMACTLFLTDPDRSQKECIVS